MKRTVRLRHRMTLYWAGDSKMVRTARKLKSGKWRIWGDGSVQWGPISATMLRDLIRSGHYKTSPRR